VWEAFLLIALGATFVFAPWAKRAEIEDGPVAAEEVTEIR